MVLIGGILFVLQRPLMTGWKMLYIWVPKKLRHWKVRIRRRISPRIVKYWPVCFVFERARELRHFLLDKGHPMYISRACLQWPGPNFIEMLSTKICLAWNFFLDKNRITNQISMWFFRICKQQLSTSKTQYARNGNLVGNPVLIKEEISCYQIFMLSSSMKLDPCRSEASGFKVGQCNCIS